MTTKNIIKPAEIEWNASKIPGFLAKKLIEEKNGGLKMIKVEPSSTYPEHVHPEKTEFVFVLEGNPHISIAGEDFEGKPSEFFILPQNVRHGIRNDGTSDCVLLVGAIQK